MRHAIAAVLVFAFAGACAAGCYVAECADCGGCGIAGPNVPGTITVGEPGTDTAGVAAVDLTLQEGECIGDDVVKFRASYASGAVKVLSTTGLGPLDTSKVTFDGSKSTWSDRDLQLTVTGAGTIVGLTFTDAGKPTSVSCTATNRTIACK